MHQMGKEKNNKFWRALVRWIKFIWLLWSFEKCVLSWNIMPAKSDFLTAQRCITIRSGRFVDWFPDARRIQETFMRDLSTASCGAREHPGAPRCYAKAMWATSLSFSLAFFLLHNHKNTTTWRDDQDQDHTITWTSVEEAVVGIYSVVHNQEDEAFLSA